MTQEASILAICAAATAGIQITGFIVAYLLQTEVFYDVLGGINFLFLGVYSAIDGEYPGGRLIDDSRKMACTIIFVCSRSWLLLFLAWRAHERGGDSRFDEVKNKFGMFLIYWLFQGAWVFVISLPVVFVNSSDQPTQFGVSDYIFIVGFGLGLLTEIVADVQKSRWVKAGRIGNFCQVGVWNYSRHPNYFGEILQWWSAWAFSYSSGSGIGDVQWWVGILSPLFTMQILLFTGGTGVANANGKSLKRYYDKCPAEYAAYRKATSILIPMVGYEYVPMFLKRTLFLDLKRYEYITESQNTNGSTTEETQAS